MKTEAILDQAALHCESHGRKLTAKRRQVLAGLVKSRKGAFGLRPSGLLSRKTGHITFTHVGLSHIRISSVHWVGASPQYSK